MLTISDNLPPHQNTRFQVKQSTIVPLHFGEQKDIYERNKTRNASPKNNTLPLPVKNARQYTTKEIRSLLNDQLRRQTQQLPLEFVDTIATIVAERLQVNEDRGVSVPSKVIDDALISTLHVVLDIHREHIVGTPTSTSPKDTSRAHREISVQEIQDWGISIFRSTVDNWFWQESQMIVQKVLIREILALVDILPDKGSSIKHPQEFILGQFNGLETNPSGKGVRVNQENMELLYTKWFEVAKEEAEENQQWPNWERRVQILEELAQKTISKTNPTTE